MIGPWLYSGRAHSLARPVRPSQNSGRPPSTQAANQNNPAGLVVVLAAKRTGWPPRPAPNLVASRTDMTNPCTQQKRRNGRRPRRNLGEKPGENEKKPPRVSIPPRRRSARGLETGMGTAGARGCSPG